VLKAHVEQALLPEGFYLRAQRDFVGNCELGGSMAVRPTAENAAKTPPTYKEALKRRKVRKKIADRHQAAFTVPLTSKQMHALSAIPIGRNLGFGTLRHG
jgi:hypothetical protein